jgi:hypothetical protein
LPFKRNLQRYSAGPLTPLATVESHILRRVVVLDPGYQRWSKALEGAEIWLWIPGVGGGEDVDAAGDAADRHVRHADDEEGGVPLPSAAAGGGGGGAGGGGAGGGGAVGGRGGGAGDSSRRRAPPVPANAAGAEDGAGGRAAAAAAELELEMFGRWAVASVESYNPVTGRHACRVEGGVGNSATGAPPTLQHVALLQRKYRVISRPPLALPEPEPEDPKGKGPKKRARGGAGAGGGVGLCTLNQVDPYPITYSLSNP